jgi:hypothetical protein
MNRHQLNSDKHPETLPLPLDDTCATDRFHTIHFHEHIRRHVVPPRAAPRHSRTSYIVVVQDRVSGVAQALLSRCLFRSCLVDDALAKRKRGRERDRGGKDEDEGGVVKVMTVMAVVANRKDIVC